MGKSKKAWFGKPPWLLIILDNLVLIIDYNGLQIDGPISQVMSPEPIAEKFRAFGCHVIEIDGHDVGRVAALASPPD